MFQNDHTNKDNFFHTEDTVLKELATHLVFRTLSIFIPELQRPSHAPLTLLHFLMTNCKVSHHNNTIYLVNSNVFCATYRSHQDLYTNIYSIKTFVQRKHKKHKIP